LRKFKYIHYVAYPDQDQLFDLEQDLEELLDLSNDPACKELIAEARQRLFVMLDPEAVDARAKKRQKHLIEIAGGREAVLGTEELAYTPPPK
jgi:choline-sulfatase